MSAGRAAPLFYFDLASPESYLAAERILAAMPVATEWVPFHDETPAPEPDRKAIEARGEQLGLQPFRWPEPWPPDTRLAMLAATYAKQIGRTVGFSLAAFRQAFAGGRDLGEENTVLIAGAACEMHPTAVLGAVRTRSVRDALDGATRRGRDAGVLVLPSIVIGDDVFSGPDAVERAATALA